MRKVQYYIATTIDGFIAHKDGNVDGFIGHGELVEDFLVYQQTVDTVLMGRKTYEFGLQYGVSNPYPHLKQYVFSRTMKETPHPEIELISENAAETVRQLKEKPGKPIWLCGAGDLAAALFREKLIDEVLIKLNPLLFGEGISLVKEALPMIRLEYVSNKPYASGAILLHYRTIYA